MTGRDAAARSFSPVFTLDKPRPQSDSDWPDIVARPVEPMPEPLMPLNAPLNGLGKSLVGSVLALGNAMGATALGNAMGATALGNAMGATVPAVLPDAAITGSGAIAICQDVLGGLFPAMRS